MYNPSQVPQLLNKTFRTYLSYQEHHFKELEEYIMCIWQITSKEKLLNPVLNIVLPDGCIDLIIDLHSQLIVFSGFSRDTETVVLEDDINFIGVRFRPGALHAMFQIPAEKVMDHTIQFSELEKQYDLSTLFKNVNVNEQINILVNYLSFKVSGVHCKQFLELVNTLYNTPTAQCVSDISDMLGYESRQLRRVFLKNYGVTPKVLLNILRLHKCLSLIFDDSKSLQDIALDCGFYDQAHFIKEIKKYTGILPTTILGEYKQ